MEDLLHIAPTHGGASSSSSSNNSNSPSMPKPRIGLGRTQRTPLQTGKTRPSPLPPLSLSSSSSSPNRTANPPSFTHILNKTAKLALSCRDVLYAPFHGESREFQREKRELESRMSEATSFEEWETTARALDKLVGNDLWKDDLGPGEYCVADILDQLQNLEEAGQKGDFGEMLFLIRNTLSRDLGGMGSPNLYRHSHTGTKTIIERYVRTVTKAIETMVRLAGSVTARRGISIQDVLEELENTRSNFGRSALMLSGGATYGMTHIGVVKALFEAKLLPRIVSGASAGSIVCAVLCTHTDEELPLIIEQFPYGDLDVFEKRGSELSLPQKLWKLLTEGCWYDAVHLQRVIRDLIGDMTFREAYNRTRRICNITVSTSSKVDVPRLLNYATAPDVIIWSAVAVSCSVPLLFKASQLLVKDPITGQHSEWLPSPQRWMDGSIDNDLPTTKLSEMFSVNHFIVSQVNPHVVPFLEQDDVLFRPEERMRSDGVHVHPPSQQQPSVTLLKNLVKTVTGMATEEALFRLTLLAEHSGPASNLFTKMCSILSQQYSGDITILPKIEWSNLAYLVTNPTSDFMVKSCLIGERGTWPKLRRIRDHCAIELAIDRAILDIKARLAFSQSQVDLRRSLGWNSGDVGQPLSRLHHRERRRSGGSLQLLIRQRQNNQVLEQILTDHEIARGEVESDSDSDDGGGVMLEMDNSGSNSSRRRQRRDKSLGASAAPRPDGGLLKPVLRRATRSHHALPFKALAQLSTARVDHHPMLNAVDNPEDFDMVIMAANVSRSGTPGSLTSPTLVDSADADADADPESPRLSDHAMSGAAKGSEDKPWPSPRDALASLQDDAALGDSSCFDADVESTSGLDSISDPEVEDDPLGDGSGQSQDQTKVAPAAAAAVAITATASLSDLPDGHEHTD